MEAGLREARFYQESGGARSPRDPALCHGLAGNAHLFNRLYQHTGRPEFLSVAAELFERVIRFDSGGGIAGFRAWTTMTGRESEAPPTDFDWSDDPTFLSGAAGVGLALVAAASDVTPEWDALMLVPQ